MPINQAGLLKCVGRCDHGICTINVAKGVSYGFGTVPSLLSYQSKTLIPSVVPSKAMLILHFSLSFSYHQQLRTIYFFFFYKKKKVVNKLFEAQTFSHKINLFHRVA